MELQNISYVIGAASLIYNIIQFITKRHEIKALKTLVQGDYNVYHNIARQCGRHRQPDLDDKKRCEEAMSAIEVIRGCADTARTNLISFSREHINYQPFYEHPAEPGKEQPTEVKYGITPESYRLSQRNGTDKAQQINQGDGE